MMGVNEVSEFRPVLVYNTETKRYYECDGRWRQTPRQAKKWDRDEAVEFLCILSSLGKQHLASVCELIDYWDEIERYEKGCDQV